MVGKRERSIMAMEYWWMYTSTGAIPEHPSDPCLRIGSSLDLSSAESASSSTSQLCIAVTYGGTSKVMMANVSLLSSIHW